MTEAEYRDHFRDLAKEPDVAGKLDIVIALLGAVLDANVSLAASWIKGYRPGDIADKVPRWGRKKRAKGAIDPSIVLAQVRAMTRQGLDNLSG